jgi:hypothetical protein
MGLGDVATVRLGSPQRTLGLMRPLILLTRRGSTGMP